MITFACPSCSHTQRVEESVSGQEAPCPACHGVMRVCQEAATLASPPVHSAATLARPVPGGPRDDRAPPGYEILSELGRGGMGVVYQARQSRLNRAVALKMILSGAHADAAEMKRFRTEAEAIARLQHPGIVAVHEIGEYDGRPFFSLEFCPGGSLEKKLSGNPMQPRDAAALVQTLAGAVQAAHEARVVHRDLKPANVLMGADGTPKITDFGLAKKLDEVGQTQTGSVLGTPPYMAPEQARGEKDVGAAADVYALGAILYECLTGRPPFKAATAYDTILQVMGQEPVPPRQLNAKVPRDLETICLKCLRKEPARRYASARELGEDLGRLLAGEPILARPVGAMTRAAKWVRRNPAVAALAALVFVALAAGVTVSTLFALDAGAKARLAEKHAEEAGRQRDLAQENAEAALASEARARANEEKARHSEARAIENEKKTAAARAQVEATLIEGLLRAIWSRSLFGESRRNSFQVDPIEADALVKLAAVPDAGTRLRLLEVALQDPKHADRVGRRADRVAAAVVGLSREQRRQAEALLARRIEEVSDEDTRLACVWLGVELEARDERWQTRAYEALVAAFGRPKEVSPSGLFDLTEALIAVSAGMSPEQAERHAVRAAEGLVAALSRSGGASPRQAQAMALKAVTERMDRTKAAPHMARAAEALAAAMQDTRDTALLRVLAEALKAVSERMEPEAAARSASQAAQAIAAAFAAGDRFAMTDLAQALHTVSDRLGEEEAARHAATAALAIVAALRSSKDSTPPTPNLLESMRLLSRRLNEKEADRVAAALVATVRKTPNGNTVSILAQALRPVLDRLGAEQAGGHAAPVAAALVAALEKKSEADSLAFLGWGLGVLGDRVPAADAARAAEALAASLGRTGAVTSLPFLVPALRAVSEQLDDEEAAEYAARACEAVVAALANATQTTDISNLATALRAAGERLGDEEAARHAARAAEPIFAALERSVRSLGAQNFQEPSTLAGALRTVCERLPPLEASRQMGRAAEILVAALHKSRDGYAADSFQDQFRSYFLATALRTILDRLEEKEAAAHKAKASQALRAALDNAGHEQTKSYLSQALDLLNLRPEEKEARGREVGGAEALLTALARTTGTTDRFVLVRNLKAAGERLSTADLVKLLSHRHCAGQSQRALLDALGQRHRRHFRSAWHFISWADANGVDWLAGGDGG